MNAAPNQREPQGKLEGMDHITPEALLKNFNDKRIVADPALFGPLYSEYNEDMKEVARLGRIFEAQREGQGEDVSALGEAVIFRCIEQSTLGSQITARGGSLFDDYHKGADIIIEGKARQQREPIISTVDVTLSQKSIDAGTPNPNRFAKKEGPGDGLEKKIGNIKDHVAKLAKIPDNRAVKIAGWIQGGGLKEKRVPRNEEYFKEVEKLILLKYYKNPVTSEKPNEPHAVFSGPKIVISLDTPFINRVIHNEPSRQKKALEDVVDLLQVEVPFSIAALHTYLEKVAAEEQKHGKGTNLFFAQYRAACIAWVDVFNSDIANNRSEEALKRCLSDPQKAKQIQIFMKTVLDTFGITQAEFVKKIQERQK
jgi:hypothetical protein